MRNFPPKEQGGVHFRLGTSVIIIVIVSGPGPGRCGVIFSYRRHGQGKLEKLISASFGPEIKRKSKWTCLAGKKQKKTETGNLHQMDCVIGKKCKQIKESKNNSLLN